MHGNGAAGQAPAAADASEDPVVVFGVVHQLVHKALAEPFQLREAVVAMRHPGELGIHTGVPAAIADYAIGAVEILDVVALAGRAHKGTGAAAQTSFRKRGPGGIVEELGRLAAAEAVSGKSGKGKL